MFLPSSKKYPKKSFLFFSLIELLVSISVIFVLMTLLVPSLSKTIKVATNVVCNNNLKQIGNAGTVYADNSGGFYFHRRAILNNRVGHPHILKAKAGSPWYNDSLVMRDYLTDDLGCPFVENVPIFDTNTNHSYRVFSYSLYFGWRFYSSTSQLEKFGDVMTDRSGKQFDIIASDHYIFNNSRQTLSTSHPGPGLTLNTVNDNSRSMSYYSGEASVVDLNFCRSDGSVVHYSDVIPQDERLEKVAKKVNFNTNSQWSLMPSN